MSPRGTKQTVTTHRVPNDRVSPDDIAARINEARARELSDTRTAAQRFMGDPASGPQCPSAAPECPASRSYAKRAKRDRAAALCQLGRFYGQVKPHALTRLLYPARPAAGTIRPRRCARGQAHTMPAWKFPPRRNRQTVGVVATWPRSFASTRRAGRVTYSRRCR